MKFFKAFSLLHRRSKSATFVPSDPRPPAPTQIDFKFPVPNHKRSSLPAQPKPSVEDISDISSVFDFATSQFTQVPTNFNHLRGSHASSSRTSRSGRLSQGSFQSLMGEENQRLREALDMWFQQYSRVEDLLQQCRLELISERRKSQMFEEQAARHQGLIQTLRTDLSRCEKRLEKTRIPGSSTTLCLRSHDLTLAETTLLPAPQMLAPSDSRSSFSIIKKLRTLDEYSSALRMTLTTRRQLRDQKKIAKFWKSQALTAEQNQDLITPSVSAISSVTDVPLPPERKAAVVALMQQRGFSLPLPSERPFTSQAELSTKLSVPQELANQPTLSILPTLPSNSSRTSDASRLAPLASESLKAEINVFFGVQNRTEWLVSTPKKRRSGPINVSPAASSSILGQSSSMRSSILKMDGASFGSFKEIGLIFSNPPSQDRLPRVKLPDLAGPSRGTVSSPVRPNADEGQRALQSSSSGLAASSVPSGSSGMFGQVLATAFGLTNTQRGPLSEDLALTDVLQTISLPVVDEISSSTPAARSWHNFISRGASPEKKRKTLGSRRTTEGKENVVGLSRSISRFSKKPSRLPVPTSAKG